MGVGHNQADRTDTQRVDLVTVCEDLIGRGGTLRQGRPRAAIQINLNLSGCWRGIAALSRVERPFLFRGIDLPEVFDAGVLL